MQELLLQRPPILLVDTFVSHDAQHTVCRFTIPPDHAFVQEERLTTAGLVEHMAQTCAARTGYIELYERLAPKVRMGVIGSVKDLEIYRWPHVGETLTTRLTLVTQWGDLCRVEAQTYAGAALLARCDLGIALTES